MNRPVRAVALSAAWLAAGLAGCAMGPDGLRPPTGARVIVEDEERWRGQAAPEDSEMLDMLPVLWSEALEDARRAGVGRRLAAQGALLDPAAGLRRAAPTPGAYLCHMVRLGSRAPGGRPWLEGGGFCFVGIARDQLSLTIEAGPQRIGGYLWEEKGDSRLVFLGAWSPRGSPIAGYGDDPRRDSIGLVERVGKFHYRLVLPWRGENRLVIFELSPAPGQ
jgi:hypothetical protein